MELTAIRIHASNDNVKDEAKDNFYSRYTYVTSRKSKPTKWGNINGGIVVLNARVISIWYDKVVGRFGENVVNNTGQRLISFCEQCCN